MNNSKIQQIAREGADLLAESPFYFKPAGYAGLIPLLAIQAIVPATREKDHALQPLFPGKSYPVVEVRLVGDANGSGYPLTLEDATCLVEKSAGCLRLFRRPENESNAVETMNTRQILVDLLCAEQSHRPSRPGFERDPIDNLSVPSWVLAERRAVLAKVNEIRSGNGFAPIDETTLVRKAEWQASGHSDYTTKYALYAAELAQRAAA